MLGLFQDWTEFGRLEGEGRVCQLNIGKEYEKQQNGLHPEVGKL